MLTASITPTSIRPVKLDAPGGTPGYVTTRQFLDGVVYARGFSGYTSTNGWSAQDIEYDVMGRAYRTSNPYYASGNGAAINSDGFWTTSTFDPLGRVTQVDMPRGDNNNSLFTSVTVSYDGVYTTVTDQAGQLRRQKLDALGRLIRLTNPRPPGWVRRLHRTRQLRTTTTCSITSCTSRKAHSIAISSTIIVAIDPRTAGRQTTNSSYNLSDSLTGNSSWSSRNDYNSHGLITNSYDARGVTNVQLRCAESPDPNQLFRLNTHSPLRSRFAESPEWRPELHEEQYHWPPAGCDVYGSGATGTYFAYDAVGRVVTQKQITGSTTYSLSYAYNLGGLLTSQTYPSGRTLTHSYDEGGRLSNE